MGIFGKLFHKNSLDDTSPLPELPDMGNVEPDMGNASESWSNPDFGNSNLGQNWSSRRGEMASYDIPDENPSIPRVSGERYEGAISPKDIQLIMSKLDLISSRLDNLNRRLESFEMSSRRDRNPW